MIVATVTFDVEFDEGYKNVDESFVRSYVKAKLDGRHDDVTRILDDSDPHGFYEDPEIDSRDMTVIMGRRS